MKGLCRIALVALVLAACGRDSAITGLDDPTVPNAPSSGGGILAIGVDSVTGASIETNKDDYSPGEVVHLVGRGWAAGETVNLHMTEAPNTHADIDTSVVADANGGFSLHFYDVQTHDLGVTFTLTATGQISNSVAVATFTDGDITALSVNASDCTTSQANFNLNDIVCAVASTAGNVDETVRFTWTRPDNSTVIATDGTSGPNGGKKASTTVTANQNGNWSVSACRLNTQSNCVGTTFSANFTVGQTNTAPTANAGTSYSGNEGAGITLSSSGSGDTDGSIASYAWSYTKNTGHAGATCGFSPNASDANPTFTCNDNGSFTVSLTVTDDDGASSAPATASVTVSNVDPEATFNAPASVAAGANINLSLTLPVEPSSNDVAVGLTYAFDCGDGLGYNAFSATSTRSCPTTSPGSRTVKGTIRDKDNGDTEYTTSVAIDNVPPTADAGESYSGNEGSSINISGSGSDPDGGTVTYLWTVAPAGLCSFGDATAASTTVTCTDNGSFTLTLKVTDDENAFTTDDATLNVDNVKPTATFNAPVSVNEGSAINLSLTAVVEPSSVDAATIEYAFDCGAGYGSFGSANSTSCSTTDEGIITVKGTVRDKDGGSTEYTKSVTVNNVAPELNLGATTASLNEGSTFARSGSFTDPGADTWTATVNYGDGGGDQSLTLNPNKTFNLSHTYPQDGAFTVTVSIDDGDEGTDTETIAVTVNNVLPNVGAFSGATINEGGTYSASGSFTDPGADTWTATVNYGDGSGTQALALSGKNFTLNHTYADDDGSPFTVTVTVMDDDGSDNGQATVTVLNVAPQINTPLTLPASPVAMGSNFSMTWTFTDPGSDEWTCKISWDQPVAYGTPFSSSGKTCSISGAGLAAGVYTVTVYVEDDDGGSDEETAATYIVVYDPNGGFVTGGGWINSVAGNYRLNLAAEGKANFGFVSKYQPGKNVPTGNTEFQFHAGDLNFKSTVYEWLVVAGTKAMYKGEGTISGRTGVYGFLLSAIDGSPDKFRIKIWEKSTGNVVYDTLPDDAADDADPATSLGGGSIVVHTRK